MLLLIYSILTNQRAVDRAKAVGVACAAPRSKSVNTSITQSALTNCSRLAKAVDPGKSNEFAFNVTLLMKSG
jgi:hypothetical protein